MMNEFKHFLILEKIVAMNGERKVDRLAIGLFYRIIVLTILVFRFKLKAVIVYYVELETTIISVQ